MAMAFFYDFVSANASMQEACVNESNHPSSQSKPPLGISKSISMGPLIQIEVVFGLSHCHRREWQTYKVELQKIKSIIDSLTVEALGCLEVAMLIKQ